MTPEIAQAIVYRVVKNHPTLSQAAYPQLVNGGARVALNTMPVQREALGAWFREQKALVTQIEYNPIDEMWFVYFRQEETK